MYPLGTPETSWKVNFTETDIRRIIPLPAIIFFKHLFRDKIYKLKINVYFFSILFIYYFFIHLTYIANLRY